MVKKETKKNTKEEHVHDTKSVKESIVHAAKPLKEKPSQPMVNIGLVGHVDHGKTTLTEKLSGKWTDTHSEEVKRGITIRLGYADASFYKCKKCGRYGTKPKCKCEETAEKVRTVSFVDAPGHESLMATMLSGATIIDGALLLVAANEPCPQPQTKEHVMALEILGLKNIIIVQNKIDLVPEDRAIRNYKEIKEFLKNTPFKDAPIIPISAQYDVNIDKLIEGIEEFIPSPNRDPKSEPVFIIARSFDINKPGTKIKDIKGGVLGGALKSGILKVGDEIEIRPGKVTEEAHRLKAKPIMTKITGIVSGGAHVEEIGPGGTIGILTTLDPSIVKSDKLTGNIAGHLGKLPPIWYDIKLETNLLERVVGAKEDVVVEPLKLGESLMLNVNSEATVGVVVKLSKDLIDCKLKLPICANKGARVTISRRVGTRFRLIGYGIIKA